MTTLEILRANRENAQESVNFAALRKEYAKICSKYFEPYRKTQLAHIFSGANEEELINEISAFNSDTKNGTRLIVRLSSTDKVTGKTIRDKDEKTLFENVESFGTLKTTDKDGNVKRETLLFSVPFVPETANDNDRVINYWFDYRATIENSFAYLTALREEENAKRISDLTKEMTNYMLSGDVAKATEILNVINGLKK